MAEVTAGADALANVLRNHGFPVIVIRDSTRAEMTEAVPADLKIREGENRWVCL
jgi:hypothetical protein